jgi:hypothetical protein
MEMIKGTLPMEFKAGGGGGGENKNSLNKKKSF